MGYSKKGGGPPRSSKARAGIRLLRSRTAPGSLFIPLLDSVIRSRILGGEAQTACKIILHAERSGWFFFLSCQRTALLAKMDPLERRIARLAAEDLTYKEICGQLDIKLGTVKANIRQILRLFGVRTRIGLAAYRNLLSLDLPSPKQ